MRERYEEEGMESKQYPHHQHHHHHRTRSRYDPNPSGFPRYTVVGDAKNGVFNLRISNASLDDDAQFQCQVSPFKTHKAIRAIANLTVIAPPISISITNHTSHSKIEIREREELSLECVANGSKPAATIVWYRGKHQLKLGDRKEERVEADARGKRMTTWSRIRIVPTAEDDRVDYACEARHEALMQDIPFRATVQLSVLYPPGLPYIEGFKTGDTIQRGQSIDLICKSHGGNPPAQLIWYKNGGQIYNMYRTSGRMSESVYTITAQESDNNATYRCDAKNIMSERALTTEVVLTVYYSPVRVTISGATEAKVNDSVQLSCLTSPSNPPSFIHWTINGRKVLHGFNRTVTAPEGGWITSSNITVNITSERALSVFCHASNHKVAQPTIGAHKINVLYPPGVPQISGYSSDVPIHAGKIQKMSCSSMGGNPVPTLTWYKNDVKISTSSNAVSNSVNPPAQVSSDISIFVNASDNEAIYKCSASNSATDIPLFETVKLSVYFPPEHVLIKVEPDNLRSDTKATLTCDGSSSNPPAELSWWLDNTLVQSGVTKSTKPLRLYGGATSSIQLTLNVTSDMDGKEFTCQATNTALQRSVHALIKLKVLYKPVFTELEGGDQMGIEGEPLLIALHARGRPSSISYVWTKNKATLKSKYVDGPVLNITKLRRSDTGLYTVTSTNSEGSTSLTFNISVQYPANITAVSENIMVSPGEEAELWCKVDGNPLSMDNIVWRKSGFNKERSVEAFNNNTSFLTVRNISVQDMGAFECVANNGFGNDSSRAVFLVVKHKPEMDVRPSLAKSAANVGNTAKLICRGSGAPKLSFHWTKDKTKLPVNTTGKYASEFIKVNEVTYESILSVRNVDASDYGQYDCIARNELGTASTSIQLSVMSVPDPPYNFSVVNITYNSIALSWKPGFNGGQPAWYKISFQSSSTDQLHYIETSKDTTETVIPGLELGTQYVFKILAKNDLGESRPAAEILRPTTSSIAPPSLSSLGKAHTGDGTLLLVGSLVGTVLLLLNALLLGCCLHRRSKKRLTGASEQGSNKSATIEMYAPSSYNETITGETLSSVSEKSESYSDNNADYGDDGRKSAAGTYLIEKIDYPFQYPGYDGVKEPDHGTIHRNYANHNGSGIVPLGDSTYYSAPVDARYPAYPPPAQFAQPPIIPPPPHRGNPPDVTVLSAPPPLLSTFTYSSMETEGHLV
ncbi:nephrin [Bemisia tabaci]|uniref:nephrin n=1 Tax=Bemisia tabaci TaxID=7038 RepID=UPI003B27DA4B